MVKFELKTNRYGQLYLPKELRIELGQELEALGDAKTVALFQKGMSAEEVLKSLRVIVADLEHRVELERGRRDRIG